MCISQLWSVCQRYISRQHATDEDYYELGRLEDPRACQGTQQPTQGGVQAQSQMPQSLEGEINATNINDPMRSSCEESGQAVLMPHMPYKQEEMDIEMLHQGIYLQPQMLCKTQERTQIQVTSAQLETPASSKEHAGDQELQRNLYAETASHPNPIVETDENLVLAFPKPLHFKTPLHLAKDVGLLAFYYPGREEAWDALCQAGFLGNFYNLPESLHLTAPNFPGKEHVFLNAEAAFQALKFWNRASEFEKLSGEESFRLKVKLRGHEDFTYGGYGGNWQGMMAVLKAKFSVGSLMGNTLCSTGDAFLLEHTPRRGRDNIWSDDCDGEGRNWLGFQLMLRRMELQGSSFWLAALENAYDLSNGKPKNVHQWQDMVRAGTKTLLRHLHG